LRDGREQTKSTGPVEGLQAAVRAELVVQVPHVRPDRVHRHIKLAGDLRRGKAGLQEAQDAGLGLAERFGPLLRLGQLLWWARGWRLVTLSLGLEEAQAAVPPGADELARRLEGAVTEVADVLAELLEIARGLHPAVLTDSGLRPALRALARRSAVPVSLDVQVKGRLPEPVEVAAYYAVAEALTNIAKYAGASAAEVEATAREGVLHVSVRDDGRGGADFGRGSGLAGLKDRVEALGGRISLDSPPGAGTTLQIALPLSGPTRPAWEG
jgi:signal transduction histidine kinase